MGSHTQNSLSGTMRIPLAVFLVFLFYCAVIEARQRKKPKLEDGQGILPCKKSTKRRYVEYGYGELKEAGIYDADGTPITSRGRGVKGLNFKKDKEYFIKTKFKVKKFSPFGSFPKYIGVKISENYTQANEGTQTIFERLYDRKMLQVQDCSAGQLGDPSPQTRDQADGCNHLTQGACPMTPEEQEIEIKMPFRVPNLPSAVTETKFRLIGLEETVHEGGCDSILNPSQPRPISTTSDLDMICFKYST